MMGPPNRGALNISMKSLRRIAPSNRRAWVHAVMHTMLTTHCESRVVSLEGTNGVPRNGGRKSQLA